MEEQDVLPVDGSTNGGSGSLSTALEGRLQSVIDTVARDARAMLEAAERDAEGVRAEAEEYARATRAAADASRDEAVERCREAIRHLEDLIDQLGEARTGVPAGDAGDTPPGDSARDLEEDQIRRPW